CSGRLVPGRPSWSWRIGSGATSPFPTSYRRASCPPWWGRRSCCCSCGAADALSAAGAQPRQHEHAEEPAGRQTEGGEFVWAAGLAQRPSTGTDTGHPHQPGADGGDRRRKNPNEAKPGPVAEGDGDGERVDRAGDFTQRPVIGPGAVAVEQ